MKYIEFYFKLVPKNSKISFDFHPVSICSHDEQPEHKKVLRVLYTSFGLDEFAQGVCIEWLLLKNFHDCWKNSQKVRLMINSERKVVNCKLPAH